jgi:hypothetical protein
LDNLVSQVRRRVGGARLRSRTNGPSRSCVSGLTGLLARSPKVKGLKARKNPWAFVVEKGDVRLPCIAFQKIAHLLISAFVYGRFRVSCQRSLKTGHCLGVKTALVGLVNAGPEGHVECPESEPANDDIQFSRSRMVSASRFFCASRKLAAAYIETVTSK